MPRLRESCCESADPVLARLEADARRARRGLWADPRATPPGSTAPNGARAGGLGRARPRRFDVLTKTKQPEFHRYWTIAVLLARVQRRVRRLLSRRGRWPDAEAGSDPFAAQAPVFASAVAASLQGRIALGRRGGQPVRRLRSAATATATGRRSARLEGFSLHADVAVPARRRDQLEKVCPPYSRSVPSPAGEGYRTAFLRRRRSGR
jgi:hypothetical protein